LIKTARANTSKPIVIYPNAGDIFDEATKEWKTMPHEHGFSESAERWYQDGARIIGGCCRTTPADINAIYKWAAKYRV
jgi:homocysteine S-methyltransferase